ncbi:hypothetical protein J7E95_27665 [Streptomyces sp. ISL-14]|nr:hypothetical protein [Streptomyces sp. ISL-14]
MKDRSVLSVTVRRFLIAASVIAGVIVFQIATSSSDHGDAATDDRRIIQRQAVQDLVREAFGDHYRIGPVHAEPCDDARCTELSFSLDGGGTASLEWPTKRHLNVLLEESSTPGPHSYPVPGSKTPRSAEDAYRIAFTYMRDHYPWAAAATSHDTYPVGDAAAFGWMTSWRFMAGDVLMPRMLDVEINRAGRVSQIDVTRGPTHIDLPAAKIDKKQAEQRIQERTGTAAEAVTLKANDRGHGWRAEWIVNTNSSKNDSQASTYWVDALTGTVYDRPYPVR